MKHRPEFSHEPTALADGKGGLSASVNSASGNGFITAGKVANSAPFFGTWGKAKQQHGERNA